jgi:tetratricopeptide (TPR) repeat protein
MSPRQAAEMRADLLNARKDYLAAAQAYEEIIKDEPRNAVVLNKIGVAYESMGDSELAERYYKKAMRADKNFGTAINNLGTLEYSNERYASAIKYYKKALGHDTDRATVYSNLGYAYSASHQYPKALEAFGKALAIDPLFFTRHGGAGPLISQRTPTDPGMLFFLLAKSYAKIGDVDHTVQYLKIARDDGYKDFAAAAKDPDFVPVILNARVREALQLPPLPPAAGPASGKTPS